MTKRRNILMSLFSFGLALLFAFASESITVKSVIVRARLGNVAGGAISCIDTNVFCYVDGTVACQIQVPTRINNGVQIANSFASGTPFVTYETGSGCMVILKNHINTILLAAPYETIWSLTTEEP
jgi:hypothetical protein